MDELQVKDPWAQEVSELLAQLNTTEYGLTQKEAQVRLERYGPNTLPENEEVTTLWGTIVATLKDKLPAMLLVSGGISGVLGFLLRNPDRFKDTVSLAVILVVMAIANYRMNKKKDASLAKLKSSQKQVCRVVRDRKIVDVEATDLTVGDLVDLKEGDIVPADARLIMVTNGSTNEASLTGESMSIEKTDKILPKETELADRANMVYMGTYVTSGTMTVVVTGVGLSTEFGKIADEIASAEETLTPLQKQLDQLGDWLLNGTLIVCGLVAVLYLAQAWPVIALLFSAPSVANLLATLSVLADILTVSVSLAIAFIPEALSMVIVFALAIGSDEMTTEGAIVKNSKAAEALGSVTIFNSDKTGTLTKGIMKVVQLWTLSGGLVNSADVVHQKGEYSRLMQLMALCNDRADATEKALADYVALAGFEIGEETRRDRKAVVPFSSARKRMSVLVLENGQAHLLTKGAPSVVLELCNIGQQDLYQVNQIANLLAGQGYRVLALAERVAKNESDLEESGLTFLGLVALIDPPRPEVVETIAIIKAAGVTPVMITGDEGRTAETIARQIGILAVNSAPNEIMSGRELEALIPDGEIATADDETLARIGRVRVFHRVSPTHKKLIVMAQQRLHHIVAMTGDGVNDAPALKQADIGVAMGDRATGVTKAVSDIILTAGYQAAAKAIRVGRTILMRTRLYIHALLSTNMAEVGSFILAAALGWATPLTSVMLLVINFLGDSWLSIALATERSEKDVMVQRPRPSNEAVITPYMWASIIIQGVLVTALLGWVFYAVGLYGIGLGLGAAAVIKLQQSAVFAVFLVQKVARSSFTARSLKYNLWQIGPFSNPWTLLAGATTALIGLLILGVAPIAAFLGMVAVPLAVLPYLLLGLIPPVVEEAIKLIRRL